MRDFLILFGLLFILTLTVVILKSVPLPQTTLVGAVVEPRNQQEINLCMNDCMRSCVTDFGTEPQCVDSCTVKCTT
jgi:hypothetical protein